MHPRNAIMIYRNQPHNIIPHHLLLIIIQTIDPRHVKPDSSEDGFPARLTVGAHNGVGGREFVADVQRGAAGRHNFVVAS